VFCMNLWSNSHSKCSLVWKSTSKNPRIEFKTISIFSNLQGKYCARLRLYT